MQLRYLQLSILSKVNISAISIEDDVQDCRVVGNHSIQCNICSAVGCNIDDRLSCAVHHIRHGKAAVIITQKRISTLLRIRFRVQIQILHNQMHQGSVDDA